MRNLWFEWLREHRPDLIPRYEQLYRRGAYAPPAERRRLARLVKGPEVEPAMRMRGMTDPPSGHPGFRQVGHEAGAGDGHGGATQTEREGVERRDQGRLF